MCGDIVSPASVIFDQFGMPTNLSLDAFQRLRVSSPSTLFDSKQVYSDGGTLFSLQTTGGATIVYNNARASSIMTVGGAGQSAIRQSRRYLSYQPGKSFQVFVTSVPTAGGQVGVKKSFGYFDSNNGIFYSLDGLTPTMTLRSDVSGIVVDNAVIQNNWNIDKLNGSGPSGITLSSAAAQIFALDFEWLGVGTVRVGFVIGGMFVPVHSFQNANSALSVYMRTPNLPIRWEISSTGGAGSLEAICCSANSEGGQDLIGKRRTASTSAGKLLAAGALQSLLQIRNRSGQYLRAPIFPLELSTMCSSTGQGQWSIIVNPTITAGAIAWTNVDANESAIEFDVGGTTITPGTGITINTGFFSSDVSTAAAQLKEAISYGASVDGTARDVICLAMRNLNPGNETYFGSITWLEPT